jgi:hypothetical protein
MRQQQEERDTAMFMQLEELRAMTRATHVKKVCKVLTQMGLPWKIGGDGNPVVLRKTAELAFGAAKEDIAPTIDIEARLQRLKEIPHGKKKTKRSRPSA